MNNIVLGFMLLMSIIMIAYFAFDRTNMQNYLIEQYGRTFGQILYMIALLPIINLALLLVLLVHVDKK